MRLFGYSFKKILLKKQGEENGGHSHDIPNYIRMTFSKPPSSPHPLRIDIVSTIHFSC